MVSSRSAMRRIRTSRKCSGSTDERLAELEDHVVGRHRPVSVDEVVEVARGESRLVRERAVGDVLLGHEPLNRRPERLVAEAALARHQRSLNLTRRSSPVARSRMSTAPSSRLFRPAVTRTGQPIRSASANFSPGRRSRSSRSDAAPAGLDRLGGALGDLLGAPQRDDVHLVRGDRLRPGDAVLVVVLLDDRGHRPAEADPVGAHHERPFVPLLVEVRGAERLGVERVELEDVADLDRGLELQGAAALRARVALARLPQVGELRLGSRAPLRRREGGSRPGSRPRRTAPRAASRPRRPRSSTPTGPREPPLAPNASRISSSVAGRTAEWTALATLPSSSRSSPRTSASTSVPSAFTTGIAFEVAAGSISSRSASASIVVDSRRLDLLGRGELRRELRRARDAVRLLDVRGVVAALAA